jgi:hypothetical protein
MLGRGTRTTSYREYSPLRLICFAPRAGRRSTRQSIPAARIISSAVTPFGTGGVEADIGPLRYVAMLLGLDSEQAMRWFILLMVLTCDPMAIVLVIAASTRAG